MENILEKVDIERLYQHVLKTEGIKHPIENPEKLNETADYIKSEFERYGLRTNEQEFKVDNFDFTFKNIEGILGDSSGPELIITSHYDTVRNAPGANDNGSAIAAMLESARILADEKEVSNIRFISFTLEEHHPERAERIRNYALELDIIDENYRYKTYHTHKMLKKFLFGVNKRIAKRKLVKDSWVEAFNEIEKNLTDSEKKYFTFLKDLNEDTTQTSWIGELGLVGSDYWVKKALEEKKEILGVINLETIGYTSKRKHSQFLPPLMHPLLFPSYKVKTRKIIGNFISVISDKNSKKLAKVFCKQCKHDEMRLPYLWVKIPFRFEKIAKWLGDLLRSDHAPFWRENIPALMITDTANFRYPYYHTLADTIDKLDFDFIKKVTQATIATVINMNVTK